MSGELHQRAWTAEEDWYLLQHYAVRGERDHTLKNGVLLREMVRSRGAIQARFSGLGQLHPEAELSGTHSGTPARQEAADYIFQARGLTIPTEPWVPPGKGEPASQPRDDEAVMAALERVLEVVVVLGERVDQLDEDALELGERLDRLGAAVEERFDELPVTVPLAAFGALQERFDQHVAKDILQRTAAFGLSAQAMALLDKLPPKGETK